MQETVLKIGAEGGMLEIVREVNGDGEAFIYHHQEFDPTDEGLHVNLNGAYDNFEQPFQLINGKYPWYSLYLLIVHEDYRDYVLSELISVLNLKGLTPEQCLYSKGSFEKVLHVKLEFGRMPMNGDLRSIKVERITRVTEFEHQEFSDVYAQEIGQKFRLKGKFETWVSGGIHFIMMVLRWECRILVF